MFIVPRRNCKLKRPAPLAVPLLVLESGGDAALVEGTLRTGLGIVGMGLGKQLAGLGGVLIEAGLGAVAAKLVPFGDGGGVIVGGFEGALAVVPFGHVGAKPAVAWAVLVPERVVDGTYDVPEHLMVASERSQKT